MTFTLPTGEALRAGLGLGSREPGRGASILVSMSDLAPWIVSFAPSHAAGVLDVIGSVFAEYGMTFDPNDYDSDLLDIDGHYARMGGAFYVLVDRDRVVGTVAAVPTDATTAEVKRLYLLPEYRGRGQGRALLELILDRIRQGGHREAIAWSDVRLETAHKVYDRLGFERIGERVIDDIDQSHEYGFRKSLDAG
jgi:putative acetyltransferase